MVIILSKADTLISWAEGQIGTAEDPKGSNNVRYNTVYYGRQISGSAYQWCMAFVWVGFKECGLGDLFMDGGKTASCTTLMRWAKANGQWVTKDFVKGDIILFQFDTDDYADHVGIFTGNKSGTSLICIEGNTNDKVARVARQPGIILGAYRPKWDDTVDEDINVPTKEPATSSILPELKFGDKGEAVRSMQQLLIAKGFYCGPYADDGEIGSATQLAIKNFQSDRKLDADGICGEKTWYKLING